MLGARTTLNLHLCLVVLCPAAEDNASPVAGFALSLWHLRGKHDRLCGGALCNQFSASFGYQGSLGLFVALDHSAWFNGQCGSVGNIHPAFEQIGAFLQGLVAGEHKFLVAVAYHRSCLILFSIVVEQ